ncbi:hypothetical protein HPB47_025296 [Ixodes persulcatus]|uniref:Uncharacterized protein n=1 Tax=Ixodes persulcatus TaxID=34615 RepID=A0AC60Q238_IXOPE|nr:hypothetical protein HPB47_025296 [Ixodes persulcatus]
MTFNDLALLELRLAAAVTAMYAKHARRMPGKSWLCGRLNWPEVAVLAISPATGSGPIFRCRLLLLLIRLHLDFGLLWGVCSAPSTRLV